jgi:uncharacterized protein YjiS (DUF1127 family)
MAYANTSRAGHSSFADRVADVFAAVKASVARRTIYNQTQSELFSLSDRELMDLGISRSQIATIAREAAYGK